LTYPGNNNSGTPLSNKQIRSAKKFRNIAQKSLFSNVDNSYNSYNKELDDGNLARFFKNLARERQVSEQSER